MDICQITHPTPRIQDYTMPILWDPVGPLSGGSVGFLLSSIIPNPKIIEWINVPPLPANENLETDPPHKFKYNINI